MSEWWDPAEVKEKRNRYLSRKDKASVSLGGCSIISILLALSITSSFIPNFNASGSGWGLVFIFFIVPLMIFSFAMSLLGICLNGGTRAGKRLCIIAFVLTFSPILMIKIIGWMLEKWLTAQWTPCPIRDTKECFLSTHVAHCSLKGYWVNFIVLNNSLLQCIFVTIHYSRENTLGDSIYSTALGTIWMRWFRWSSQRYQ